MSFTEEYNDNVLFNNNQRRWDLVTGIIPGVTFTAQQPTWHATAAYDFTTRLYTRDPNRDQGFDRQNFTLDSAYEFTPTFGVALTDGFAFDTGINTFAPQGVAVTGRDRMWSNRLRPSASFSVDPLTTVRGGAGWAVQRFERSGLVDSDIWEVDADVERVLTPRLRGVLGYTYMVLLTGYADSKKRIDVDIVDEAVEYLEEGERREWKRSRNARLVPTRFAVWAARAGVTAVVALIALMLIFAANALGWLGGVIR